MPTYAYGPIEAGAITIHEQECSYQVTATELKKQIADLKASHNRYSDEALYKECLRMLEGALKLLQEKQAS
jgi:hypothetical protein